MHQPAAFVQTDPAKIRALIAENPFGVLVSQGEGGLAASHVPMVLARGESGGEDLVLEGHLAAANGQCPALAGGAALAIFPGPHAAISPAWYAATGPAVPTWDYAAVHVHGVLEEVTGAALEALLRRQGSEQAEGFDFDTLPAPLLGKLLAGIRGFRLRARRVEAQWKLSQNRSEAERRGVIARLRAKGESGVADLMAATLTGAD